MLQVQVNGADIHYEECGVEAEVRIECSSIARVLGRDTQTEAHREGRGGSNGS